jgi:hypothetical protein
MNAGATFGTSLVATEIVVVKEEGAVSHDSAVDTSGMVFEDDATMEDVEDEG